VKDNNMRKKNNEVLPLAQRLTVREMAAHLPRKEHREKPTKNKISFLFHYIPIRQR
jgi:hypothetical protein